MIDVKDCYYNINGECRDMKEDCLSHLNCYYKQLQKALKEIALLKEENYTLTMKLRLQGVVDVGFWDEKGEYKVDLQEIDNG